MTQSNSERAAYVHGQLIHEAVARQARSRPDQIAVVQGNDRLTYRELDAVSDDYAVELRSRSVLPGRRVPVLMARTPQFVAVVLAVLKCGAAYAALDTRWPEERLRSVIRQLKAPVLATSGPCDLGAEVWEARRWPVEEALLRGRPAPAAECSGDSPASIFFTSGSTGLSKGVVTPHRATMRLFQPGCFADFGPSHVTAASVALHWDAASLEIWGPLVSGGTVALIEDEFLLPAGLARLVRDQHVDTVWLTSSLFNMFVDEDLSCFRALRSVLTGGERLSPHHVKRFLQAHPSVRLTNGYGPVESCVFASTHPVVLADCDRPSGIPIGRAVPHTQLYVLNGGEPCPAGETGEIFIGGDGLATEYLDLPKETAARFAPVEAVGETVRLYRTGDLGFTTDDGLLHYVGRADRQVKIRGHRIEPQGVEAVCLSVPGVKQAVVVPVADDEGAYTGLALFYVPESDGDAAVHPSHLRARLRAELPAYCVPGRLTPVPTIPLTPNGKADVHLLMSSLTRTPSRAEPATALPAARDAMVLEEFRAVLGPGVEADIPINALGGTSLDAIRLCARLSARTGIPLGISAFLRAPTVNGVAQLLASRRAAEQSQRVVVSEEPDQIALTGMRAGFLLLHELDPTDSAAICPLLWAVSGPLRIAALEQALTDVHRRHQALRAEYHLTPDPVAALPDRTVEFRVEILDLPPGDTKATSRLEEALNRPLRIEDAEVWRCVYARIDDSTHLLGIAVHHVAFDSWSQEILVTDLVHAYNARGKGVSPEFDGPAPTLHRVALEAATHTDPEETSAQLWHWTTALADMPDLVFPAPPDSAEEPFDSVGFTVDAATASDLRTAAAGIGATEFLPLLACYAGALADVVGQADFGIGVPVVRRSGAHSVRAVSCLVDVLCLRMAHSAQRRTIQELMEAARPVVEAAFTHQDVPFADVVTAIQPPRTGRNPLFQTMFAYQNTSAPELSLSTCTAAPLRVPPRAAMHELVCEVWPERGGGVRVDISYQPHHVGRETVKRLARAYEALLLSGQRPSQRDWRAPVEGNHQ
ncbi:amino acid adenylation domain-containing protein [Streptomyces wuyuanensis]|uniref:amino acid adenylation domain-containing protein n=1 Tax=Streptomyces wuyuanensis TaxID=1196353 RepID=UPI00371C9997